MSDGGDRLARRRVTFVQDARSRLAALSDGLLALERNPADRAALDKVRRALHTLKGNAGLVGLETLAATAHALEDALADESAPPSPALLLRGLDVLSAMVALVAESVGQSGPPIPAIEALKSPGAIPGRMEPALFPTRSSEKGGLQPSQIAASVHHLDSLLELVEELRVAHSELAQSPREMLERHLARQRRLLHELHNTVLETRLLPVGRAFEGFERLVRDLAEGTGRRAALAIEGAEIEIDRSALDPVRELVVHLLRNALAHGIEPSEERETAGKPAGQSVIFATIMQVNQPRTVRFISRTASPRVHAWLGGIQLKHQQRYKLEPGEYSYFGEIELGEPDKDVRLDFYFVRSAEDPARDVAAWREDLAGARPYLERVVQLQPDGDTAKKASAVLAKMK